MKTKQEILKKWYGKTKEPYLWGVQAQIVFDIIKDHTVEQAIILLEHDREKYKDMSCSLYSVQAINDLEELKQPVMP